MIIARVDDMKLGYCYTLHLTTEEMTALYAVARRIGGHPNKTPRGLFSKYYKGAVSIVDVIDEHGYIDVIAAEKVLSLRMKGGIYFDDPYNPPDEGKREPCSPVNEERKAWYPEI